jgi:hypothetical protein
MKPHFNGKKKKKKEKEKPGMVVHTCHLNHSRTHEIEGSWSRPAWEESKPLATK